MLVYNTAALVPLNQPPWCERECTASVLARRGAIRTHVSWVLWVCSSTSLLEHLEIVSVGRESLVPSCSLGKAALELGKILT